MIFVEALEKFEISEIEDCHKVFLAILKSHFEAIVDYTKADKRNALNEVKLEINGKCYKNLSQIPELTDSARSMSIKFSYSFETTSEYLRGEGINLSNEKWTFYLNECSDEFLASLYCASWILSDMGNNINPNGVLIAFGEKDGKIYRNEVPFIKADKIPECDWYTVRNALSYESEKIGEDKAQLEAVFDRISHVCGHGLEDVEINFERDSVNATVLCQNFRSEQLVELVGYVGELRKLTPEVSIDFTCEYYNLDSMILRIELNDSGNIIGLEIAEI